LKKTDAKKNIKNPIKKKLTGQNLKKRGITKKNFFPWVYFFQVEI